MRAEWVRKIFVRENALRCLICRTGFGEANETVWRCHGLPEVGLVASGLDRAEPHGGDLGGTGLRVAERLDASRDGGPPYRVLYSPRLGDCPRCGPASCKATVLRELRRPGDTVWVFGDGASDLCPAREADVVFARGHLAELCSTEGLPWRALDFVAALEALREVTA